MSNKMNTSPTIRWQLLSTVSAAALLASAYTAQASDSDADRPLIWVELGGQMENIGGAGEPFAPPFLAANPDSSVLQKVTPTQAQQLPKFVFGEEGKISFQPEDSDWSFSAAARIGRSGSPGHVDHQTNRTFVTKYVSGVRYPGANLRAVDKFADTHAPHQERHAILDFSVGKDVGLGMFGKDSTSTLSLGVRIAQFTTNSKFEIRARPEVEFKYRDLSNYLPGVTVQWPYYHTYHATGQAERSFRGVGPSLSWSGSAPFAGDVQDGELTIDWGINASLLFGRQKAHVQHHESAHYVTQFFIANGEAYTAYDNTHPSHNTDRSVTVPNVGGSMGLSWRLQDFKISLGYRYDSFLKAMDTGIDARKTSNLTFNGPYASISIGLGD